MTVLNQFLRALAEQPAVLVTLQSQRGSVPRDVGTWMAVLADSVLGTIGGGHLEWQALAEARALAAAQTAHPSAVRQMTRRYALGPSLGQCCGGEVLLGFEWVSHSDLPALRQRLMQAELAWPHLALFGAGHVGCALVRILVTLPLHLRWIDSRDGVFPQPLPAHVTCDYSEPVHAAVTDLPGQSQVLVMSFSHAEDLAVLVACLTRQRQRADLGFIGLIGSQTKWASFRHQLQARGFTPRELAQICCPIGVPGIVGKQPEVIAVAVAAQLLQVFSSQAKPERALNSTGETGGIAM